MIKFLQYLFSFVIFLLPSSPPSPSSPISTPSIPTPTPILSPIPKPTLSFSEMNNTYGPCIRVPVLLYHHIEEAKVAKSGGFASLTVNPSFFEAQLAYLNDHKYTSITPAQLSAFFDQRQPLPSKPVLLTFDDGYADFYTQAVPLLTKYHIFATLFLPTGLVNNPGFMSWDQVQQLPSKGIYVGNHTWSHTSKASDISPAHTQLLQHQQNPDLVFAYPFGTVTSSALSELNQLQYRLAFTTKSGTIQCAQLRLQLPRLHIGNSALSAYGL